MDITNVSPLMAKQWYWLSPKVWNPEETPVILEQTAVTDIGKVSVAPPCRTWFVSRFFILFPFCTENARYCPLTDRWWWEGMLTKASDPLPQVVCPMEEDALSPVSLCSAPPLPPLPSVTPRYSSTRTPCCFLCHSCAILRPPSSSTTLFHHRWPSQSATVHKAFKLVMCEMCPLVPAF